jgi:class 3 adenylate cyclase/putative methionine-R-sulfoxide reductase with GAF domain
VRLAASREPVSALDLPEQQAAIADVLQSIARAEFDRDAVIRRVLEHATRLGNATHGLIDMRDGDVYRHIADYGAPRELVEFDLAHPIRPGRGTLVGRTVLDRRTIHIPDVLEDPEYQNWEPQRLSGFRAMLGVPMIRDDIVIGVLSLWRNEPVAFTNREIELVSLFADQAVVATEIARLLTETARSLERERATADVLKVINRSTFDLQALFDVLVEKATRLCDGDWGDIVLLEGDGLRMVAQVGGTTEFRELNARTLYRPTRGTAIGRMMVERRPVAIADVRTDPEYTWEQGMEVGKYRSVLTVPILRGDELLGGFALNRLDVRPFTDAEIALISTFADQAAIAIENVRLFRTVERQREELSRFVSPQIASLLASKEGATLLAGHRRKISVLFCDLRGFTAFSETAEPEEVFDVLHDFHGAMGELITELGGTLEHFEGDGMMVFFNDPVPLPAHEAQAVRLAVAMRTRFAQMATDWRKRGYELGLGVGVAVGYATLGRIGFEGRYDYGAVGGVVNLAARLAAEAAPDQILVSQRVQAEIEGVARAEDVGELRLKGFTRPIRAFNVISLA